MLITQPFPFTPIPTTSLVITTYLIITIVLLVIHFVPPGNIPSQSHQDQLRISIVDAWHDLEHITADWGYHPYNSRANDKVKEYISKRVQEILKGNDVKFSAIDDGTARPGADGGFAVRVIDDIVSNVTFAAETEGVTVYYEGTNLLVIIKGSQSAAALEGSLDGGELGAVLVNSHYDSVSTGYGATDDGTAVVTLLQLISFFTNPNIPPERRPRRDIIFLFNNGEEDYLNGARAFAVSPWAHMPKIFLNLEGAGAGGRATLFRTSDTEVTEFYKSHPRPFGMSISADGFKKGLVRSQTDYKVFTEDLGMRGLDVAFWRPRSRYHTEDDDVRHTSRESIWHMLSGAIASVQDMSMNTAKEFQEPFGVGGTESVWFDMFGRSFVLFRLHTLFAISVTLATVTPLVILITIYLLYRNHQLYMFSNRKLLGKPVNGWKGFFVYPAAFILASSAVISTAYLFVKVNPMIVYGHLYTVWACFLSEWFLIAWFVSKVGQWWRSSALTRGYTFGWMWLGWWILLVYASSLEDTQGISAGYFIMFSYVGTFLAFWISLLEQFFLPAQHTQQPTSTAPHPLSPSEQNQIDGSRLSPSSSHEHNPNAGSGPTNPNPDTDDQHSPTETSPLLSSRWGSANSSISRSRRHWRPSFRRQVDDGESSNLTGHDSDASEGEHAVLRAGVYKYEQRWSREMPTGWGTWVLQWLLSVPVQIILVGQIGLFLGEALGMTGADGSNLLTVYLGIAFFSILYLLPIAPYLHRITHHLAYLCIVVFFTTFIFNLSAFPFTSDARLKVYFQQDYNLDNGANIVSIVGVEEYVRLIIENELPSAYGKQITCTKDPIRDGLVRCSWEGLPPHVAPGKRQEWVQRKVRRTGRQEATIELKGRETRACKLLFDKPIFGLKVNGAMADVKVDDETYEFAYAESERTHPRHYPGHYPQNGGALTDPQKLPPYEKRSPVYPGGTTSIRLWSREWERGWSVDVSWNTPNMTETTIDAEDDMQGPGLTGKIVCLWSDVNQKGIIPAWDELAEFAPAWAVGSKLADGLVEAWWAFEV